MASYFIKRLGPETMPDWWGHYHCTLAQTPGGESLPSPPPSCSYSVIHHLQVHACTACNMHQLIFPAWCMEAMAWRVHMGSPHAWGASQSCMRPFGMACSTVCTDVYDSPTLAPVPPPCDWLWALALPGSCMQPCSAHASHHG